MRASRRAATFFPLAESYRFCGKRGAWQGVSGARRRLRHEGVQESEEGRDKREGDSCWKSGGGRVRLYTWRRARLADEGGSDTTPEPDRVIHRYLSITPRSIITFGTVTFNS
jgi:hypothetical protein